MANEFSVHRLNPTGLECADRCAAAFDRLLTELDVIGMESGRERAIVVTKLQEASFFAKRAVALNPANQIK